MKTITPAALRRVLPALAAALLVNLGCTVTTGADPVTETRTLTKSFPATGSEMLHLANLAGRVEIVVGDGDAVTVEATVHAAGRNAADTQSLLAGMSWVEAVGREGWALSYPVDRHSTIRYPRGSAAPFGLDRSSVRYQGRKVTVVKGGGSGPVLYADLRITFPRGTRLDLRNAVGTVDAAELVGDLSLDTASGDVSVAGLVGTLSVDTGSGDVRLGAVNGSAEVDTGSGDVEVASADGEKLVVDTGSGDVEVGRGRLRLLDVDTGSGDVAARDLDAERIAIDTGSGDVRLESPLNWARDVVVDTGSGDVEIYADPAASFHLATDIGSGDVDVRYRDAQLIRKGHEVVGADRGDGHTRIDVDTGSGDCVLAPRG